MKKKLLTMFMMVLLCLPFITPLTANAADTSYKTWLQSDPEWGSIHLGTSDYTMKSSGCLVTSIAMLICHTGSADPSEFTPGTLVNYLNNNGGFTSGGALYWAKVDGAVPGFSLVNYKIDLSEMTKSEKTAKMSELLEAGYAVIVSVKNGGHWVALDRIDGSKVYMMDPASDNTDLYAAYSESGVDRLAIYQGRYSSGTGSSNENTGNTSGQTGKVNCSSLNVRSGAGTNHSVVTTISRDTVVTILGKAKDGNGAKWYKISVNGKTGYASAQYITVTSSGSSESNSEQASGTGIVNCSSLNVRSGAGTKYDVVTTISKNQSVTITSKTKDSNGDLWYGIDFSKSGKKYSGYAFAEYITLSSTNESEPEESIPAVVNCDALNMRSGAGTGYSVVQTLSRGTEVNIIGEAKDSDGTRWYKISVGGKTGYVHSAYLTKKGTSSGGNSSDTPSEESTVMAVAYDSVNVRSGASTSKSVVCVVHKDEKVTVTGQAKDSNGDVWYKVETASGKKGYIRSDLLKKADSENSGSSSGSSEGAGQKMQVAYDGVNMRKGAGTSYDVVEVIYLGDTLTVLGQDKDSSGNIWYKVKAASGNTGYIRSDMLKEVNGSSGQTGSQEKVTGTVTGGWLNVRSGAGTSYEVLAVIPEGTKVTITESVKDSSGSLWYHITVSYSGSNYDGYVSAQYIQK